MFSNTRKEHLEIRINNKTIIYMEENIDYI
jgi:hypothetical protein